MISPLLVALATSAVLVPQGGEVVAIQAGTIHLIEDGAVVRGGGTILARDGRIVGVGKDVDVPFGARVVDYGPTSLILQAHGSSEKLDALIDLLRPFRLTELVRSGKLLMARGQAIT